MRKAELVVNLMVLSGIPVIGLTIALSLAGPIAAIIFVCVCFALVALLLTRVIRGRKSRKD